MIVAASTEHPDSAWVCEQSRPFAERTKDREKKPEMIIHDRDAKYTKEFTATVKACGVKINPLPKGSPNLNGRCEPGIETIKLECLAKFVGFGERLLDHILNQFTEYYNTKRSHMERGYLPPFRDGEPEEVATVTMEQIEGKQYVAGLVKSFERRAA